MSNLTDVSYWLPSTYRDLCYGPYDFGCGWPMIETAGHAVTYAVGIALVVTVAVGVTVVAIRRSGR